MKILSLGLDQLTISDIRQAGYNVVMQTELPEPQQTSGKMMVATSGQIGVSELRSLREKYLDTIILYLYMERGVRGYHGIHLTCEELGMHFLPPRSTSSAILEKIRLILKEDGDERGNVVGVLGSGPGIGCTSAAGLLAARIAAAGRRVIMLGMNVYDPGYDRKAAISLDRIRPKLTGNRLHDEDFDQWISQDGYRYLPGNFDYLSAQDYQENEMEYLLKCASDNADIVIADLGSVPESAAWYTGMRKSSLRLLVTHPRHEYRLESLMDLAGHMDLLPQDFKLIMNRGGLEETVSPKSMALRLGIEIFLDLPYYPQVPGRLPLGKRELAQVDDKVRALLAAFGFAGEVKKKGMFL